jgi:hypothetical protein
MSIFISIILQANHSKASKKEHIVHQGKEESFPYDIKLKKFIQDDAFIRY